MAYTEVTVSEPSVHDSWMEFAQGPLDMEELGARIGKRLSVRSTPRGVEPLSGSICSPDATEDGFDVLSAGNLEVDFGLGSPHCVDGIRNDWRPQCSALGAMLSSGMTPAVQRLVSTGADVIGTGTRPRASSLRSAGVHSAGPSRPPGNAGQESRRMSRRHPLIARRSI